MYHRDEQDFNRIMREYNAKNVTDSLEYTEREIVRITENLELFIDLCKRQLEVIAMTTIKQYVYLRRHQNYSTKRIEYWVGLMNCPDIENPKLSEWSKYDTIKEFAGNEKKAAKEYARGLAEKYNCEVREEG